MEICLNPAPTDIIAEYPSGKLPTTFERLRISFMIRSKPLFATLNILHHFKFAHTAGDFNIAGCAGGGQSAAAGEKKIFD